MPIAFKKFIAVFTAALLLAVSVPPPPAGAITVKEEKELSKEFLTAVFDYYDVIEDPMINDYINSLGKKIVAHVPPQPFEFHFYAINQDTFNAFAGPGGHVFVFSGLIEALDNENELAAILAHEIAHVSGRHISDLITKSKTTSIATMAGLIAGILVGLGGASALGSALSIGSIAAGQSMSLAYTRENEMEADTLGRKYLTESDYELYGLLSALKKIRSNEWFGEEEIPTYLKTHPATADRITSLNAALSGKNHPASVNSYAFERTRARIIALYGRRANVLERFAGMIKSRPNNPALLYGYGLALAENGQPEAAVARLKSAMALRPDDPYIAIALGQAQFLSGDYASAEKTLKTIDRIRQYGPDGLFYLGRVQMATNNFVAATITFEKLLAETPDHEQTLYFLGQSYGELGKLGEAHFYLGRYYLKLKDPQNTRFHFDQALKHTTDPEKRAQIEEQIKGLKNMKAKISDEDEEKTLSPPGLTTYRNGKISWKTSPDPVTRNEGPSYNQTFSTSGPWH